MFSHCSCDNGNQSHGYIGILEFLLIPLFIILRGKGLIKRCLMIAVVIFIGTVESDMVSGMYETKGLYS